MVLSELESLPGKACCKGSRCARCADAPVARLVGIGQSQFKSEFPPNASMTASVLAFRRIPPQLAGHFCSDR